MSEACELGSAISPTDLGDATLETKQHAPWPPWYQDWIFAYGSEPNTFLE